MYCHQQKETDRAEQIRDKDDSEAEESESDGVCVYVCVCVCVRVRACMWMCVLYVDMLLHV